MTSDVIWVDYPIARFAGFLVLIVLLIFRKKLMLRIRDLPVEQRKDISKQDRSTIFKLQLKLIEKLLVWKADAIVLSVPDFTKYITPRTSRIIVFPTGVCKDQLVCRINSKRDSSKYILEYAGSLDRSGMIEKLSSMFSEINGWEFWIAGKGDEKVAENQNTKYFGLLSYPDVQRFYEKADAIIVPYPNKEYYKICIPLKMGEILATCKPIIMLKLPSIEKYLKFVGLENNVIYVDEWSKEELEKALEKAKLFDININDTMNKLKAINWEQRIEKLMMEIDKEPSGNFQSNDSQLRWI